MRLLFLLVCLSLITVTLSDNCNLECSGADHDIVLIAGVNTIQIGNAELGMNFDFLTRTYYSPDGTNRNHILGPDIRVRPGDTLNILLKNHLLGEDGNDPSIGPDPPTAEDYFQMVHKNDPKNPYRIKLPNFYGTPPETWEGLHVDHVNMPGNFDVTNLHLHGLEVETHMYHPQSTLDRNAPHIMVKPSDCYCYKFTIPEHEPVGLYWYHSHFHNSVAIQTWCGMFGLIFVDPKEGEEEIGHYNTSDDIIFPVWDPHFKYVSTMGNKTLLTVRDRIITDDLIADQTGASKMLYMVGDDYQPTYYFKVGQTRRIRILCATTENFFMFSIFKSGNENTTWDNALPFYAVASDGVSYPPVMKTRIVMVGGQRQDVMVSFDKPGTYVIRSQGLERLQFFNFGPPNATIAKIVVTGSSENFPSVHEMKFKKGLSFAEDIVDSEITKREELTFNLFADTRVAPFPQFHLNGAPYRPHHINYEGKGDTAIEWVITNPSQATHPFHVHVNRFQVKEIRSSMAPTNLVQQSVVDTITDNIWRDTVTVPPFGSVVLWMRYGPVYGKTMLHCHFLAHEDTGMVGSLLILPPDDIDNNK